MGFFSKLFKGEEDAANTLFAPVDGKAVPVSQVSDPTFADEILGKGLAIKPSSNTVYSPCDGTIDLMFDTGHAVNLVSDSGIEILIHIGLDTVSLKGKHFKTLKNTGDKVRKGDPLIEFEKDEIAKEGFDYIKQNFQYSIIENFNAKVDDKYVLQRESYWKDVLQTRKFGYNKN